MTMYLTYDLHTGEIVGTSTSEPMAFEGYGSLAVPIEPPTGSFITNGTVRARQPINWSEPDKAALMTVNHGAPELVSKWREPTTAGTYVLRAVGAWTGEKTVVVDDLEALRASRLEAVADLRRARLSAGVVTPYGTIQADEESRTNIAGAVNLAVMDGLAFSTTWRTADNKSVKLTAAQMIDLGRAVARFTSKVYESSFQLKEAITAAKSIKALHSVDMSLAV